MFLRSVLVWVAATAATAEARAEAGIADEISRLSGEISFGITSGDIATPALSPTNSLDQSIERVESWGLTLRVQQRDRRETGRSRIIAGVSIDDGIEIASRGRYCICGRREPAGMQCHSAVGAFFVGNGLVITTHGGRWLDVHHGDDRHARCTRAACLHSP